MTDYASILNSDAFTRWRLKQGVCFAGPYNSSNPAVRALIDAYVREKDALDRKFDNFIRGLRESFIVGSTTKDVMRYFVGIDHGRPDPEPGKMVLVDAKTMDIIRNWHNRPSMLVPSLSGYPTIFWDEPKKVPPSLSIKTRASGCVVVTVNLSKGGFTCFLRPPAPPDEEGKATSCWTFGFSFRAPQDEPSKAGADIASKRCGKVGDPKNGGKPVTFAGLVDGVILNYDGDRDVSWNGGHMVLTLRALRVLRKRGDLANVQRHGWWTDAGMKRVKRPGWPALKGELPPIPSDDSMRQATEMLNEPEKWLPVSGIVKIPDFARGVESPMKTATEVNLAPKVGE